MTSHDVTSVVSVCFIRASYPLGPALDERCIRVFHPCVISVSASPCMAAGRSSYNYRVVGRCRLTLSNPR